LFAGEFLTMAVRGEMTVRFWGVRGSYPTPGGDMIRYGGNTACVEIEAGGSTIVLDAGTGIVPLSRSLMRQIQLNGKKFSCLLLFSHLHHDHTQGFPFFSPARIPGADIYTYGPGFNGHGINRSLEHLMGPPYFPLGLDELHGNLLFGKVEESAALYIGTGGVKSLPQNGKETPELADCVKISTLYSDAHPGGIHHYRIEYHGTSLVYATDREAGRGSDERLRRFARGADLLIHDAQYTDEHYYGRIPGLPSTQGFGHSTVRMACEAAKDAGARKLILFHHAPENDDAQIDQMTAQAQQIFPGAASAYEGLQIRLGANGNTPE
jgi:phosphoribosyl 1,2-cyclic phosphodiesterase